MAGELEEERDMVLNLQQELQQERRRVDQLKVGGGRSVKRERKKGDLGGCEIQIEVDI